jgi:hypothetical protein
MKLCKWDICIEPQRQAVVDLKFNTTSTGPIRMVLVIMPALDLIVA